MFRSAYHLSVLGGEWQTKWSSGRVGYSFLATSPLLVLPLVPSAGRQVPQRAYFWRLTAWGSFGDSYSALAAAAPDFCGHPGLGLVSCLSGTGDWRPAVRKSFNIVLFSSMSAW